MNNDNKFAIVMATFCRKNGKTPEYLKRSIESIRTQTNNNWDLIIVADKYEPKEELDNILNEFANKLSHDNQLVYIYNSHVEREHIVDKNSLWCVAGATSINYGLMHARLSNYKYYAHLDDDDYWANTHIEKLTNVYNSFPNCIFACSQSQYGTQYILPRSMSVFPNNLTIGIGQLIHSAMSFRIDIIPFSYTTHFEEFDNVFEPADGNILNKIRRFLEKHKEYCAVYNSELTCYHIEEGLNR
jgi:glycosyltransferase involved in cell wall biosynthesis